MKPTEPTRKVLVVGGSAPAQKKLEPSLGDEGYEVVSTGDGDEAPRGPSRPMSSCVDAALTPREGYWLCRVTRDSAAL